MSSLSHNIYLMKSCSRCNTQLQFEGRLDFTGLWIIHKPTAATEFMPKNTDRRLSFQEIVHRERLVSQKPHNIVVDVTVQMNGLCVSSTCSQVTFMSLLLQVIFSFSYVMEKQPLALLFSHLIFLSKQNFNTTNLDSLESKYSQEWVCAPVTAKLLPSKPRRNGETPGQHPYCDRSSSFSEFQKRLKLCIFCIEVKWLVYIWQLPFSCKFSEGRSSLIFICSAPFLHNINRA